MAKKALGCLFGLVGLAIGGGAVFVHVSDSEHARRARAKLAEWGLDIRRDSERPAPSVANGKRTDPGKRPAKAPEAKKPETAEPVGVAKGPSTAPTTPESGAKPEDWGPLAGGASEAEAARAADAKARAAIDKATAAYRALDCAGATAALAGSVGVAASAALRAEADALAARIALATELTADIERNELSDHRDVVEVELTNGRVREGRLVKDDGRQITIAGDYGISATFPRDQVREVRRLSAADRRARLESQLASKRKQLVDPTGLALFKLAEWCVANGLPARAVELIEAAAARDVELRAAVRHDRAARLFHHWMYLRARRDRKADEYAARLTQDYADTAYADQVAASEDALAQARAAARRGQELEPAGAGATVAEPEPSEPEPAATTSDPDRPAAGGAAVSAAEREGDDALAKAQQFAEAAQPGKPDYAKQNKQAIAWYKKAMAAYDRAMQQAKGADLARLEEKAVEAGEGLFWAKRMSSVGG
jgi:hypothetical protein